MYPQISLSEENRRKIISSLPGQINQETGAWLRITPPEWIDAVTGPNSSLSVSFICLLDAVNVGLSVDYALFQAHVHLSYFREEHVDAPQEKQAIDYCRFYVDDAALRIYAAGEHIANAIINLLKLQDNDLKIGRNASLATTVGKHLIKNFPELHVTQIVKEISKNDAWIDTINYRNEWVHNQPRLIAHPGPGVNYKRRTRWRQPWEGVWLMSHGGDTWDKPEITIENLLSMVTKAGFALEKMSFEMSNLLYKELEPKITRNLDTGELIPKNIY